MEYTRKELESKMPPHNIEAEQAILGAILCQWKSMAEVVQHILRSPHIKGHFNISRSVARMLFRSGGIVTVASASGEYCCCHCAAKDGCNRHKKLFHCCVCLKVIIKLLADYLLSFPYIDTRLMRALGVHTQAA